VQLGDGSFDRLVGHCVVGALDGASAHTLRENNEMSDLRESHLLSAREVIEKHSVFVQVQCIKEAGKFLAFGGEGRLLRVGGLSLF
jgi:hypothetical protein